VLTGGHSAPSLLSTLQQCKAFSASEQHGLQPPLACGMESTAYALLNLLLLHGPAQVGARLVVLNLSQQTDSSDLLGGFRPVEARAALAPLLARFQELVADTWTRGRNAEFLARVARVAERRKWPQLLAAFRSALRKV